MKDLPTPATDGQHFNFSPSPALLRLDSSSSADTATRGIRAADRDEEPQYFRMAGGEADEAAHGHRSRDLERLSLQGNHSGQGGDGESSSEVFEGEDIVRKRSDLARSMSEVRDSVDSNETIKPRSGLFESIPKRKLSRQESQSHEALVKKVLSVRKTSLSESETQPPIIPIRKMSRDSIGGSSESEFQPVVKPNIIRRLSRQESQGKVGRQNTLAIDCTLAASHSTKRISSQPSLPPQQEEETSPNDNQATSGEKGSRNSLMMPSETMC